MDIEAGTEIDQSQISSKSQDTNNNDSDGDHHDEVAEKPSTSKSVETPLANQENNQ